ncbi:EAL domain-containing protein [Ramlibacter sp. H39-3-26]|uniref:sensor domain-containing protein n=1 Tax=Curvibacter soli TaxID=3031331 RepID=UPI0023DB6F99|nr:bifunctional diguanylate cyclase/phosphodiesterase [Ramlibacter sp. H39-3-26]MDF1485971.1 EAL domain-containing protein [Ramlibacter sp. H39-3-26]
MTTQPPTNPSKPFAHFVDSDSFFMEDGDDDPDSHPAPLRRTALPAAMREVLQQLPVMVHATDASGGQYVFWNRECEIVTGYSASEMVGSPQAMPLLYPNAIYLERKKAECAAMGIGLRDVEWTLIAKTGERKRIAWSIMPRLQAEAGGAEQWYVGVDVTARFDADRLVRARDKLLRTVFRHLPDMVHLKDGAGRWLLANPAARALVGLGEKETHGFTNLDLADLGHPAAESLRQSALNEEATWQSGGVSHTEEVLQDETGSARYYDVVRVPTFGRRGQRLHMLVLSRDITDQRSAATKLELAGKVLDLSKDGIIIFNADNRVMMVNAAYSTISGFAADDVIGQPYTVISAEQQDGPALQQAMHEALLAQGRWSGEVWGRRKNGEVYPQWLSLSALRDRGSDEITHYVATISDLSSSKAAEQRIAYLSTQDTVTGLPNRAQAAQHAARALAQAQHAGEQVALLVTDVDNFKTLNDSLGHAAGDELLRRIGERLSGTAGVRAFVGRLSGDEFMVMLPGVHGTADAAHMARRLMEAVGAQMELGGMPMSVSISVGIAMFPSDGESFDVLFGRADAALHAAKREGRAVYQFANAAMNAAALERLQLESGLRRAIETNALRLEYQPLVELASGRIVGAEALCRWDHPKRGPVPPAVFIPVAEDSGLIEALGGWVLRTATRQLRAWHDAGHAELMMAVNLSARQFQRGIVLQQVEDALVEADIPAEKLELELTESVLLHDGEAVMAVLRRLKALGVKLSMDDFGTGYSSLAYLRRFKFDKIKIDQSFVRDMIDDPDNAAIVRGIISLALSLGLDVLAEGVEDETVATRLRHWQCTFAQGYHFARPMRPEAFIERLRGG